MTMCGIILIFAFSMSLMIGSAEKMISTNNEEQPGAEGEAREYFIAHHAE